MEPIRVQRQDYRTRGTYVATIPGIHGIARLNYKHERPGLIVAEHTEVSDTLKETGAGLALLTQMVEDARREGVRIYAMCSYVEYQRRAHPEWADVFHVPSQAAGPASTT